MIISTKRVRLNDYDRPFVGVVSLNGVELAYTLPRLSAISAQCDAAKLSECIWL